MQDPIVIRRGVPADAERLAELAARTFRDTFAADNRPEDMDAHEVEAYGPDIQRRELENPRMTTLIADSGEELAAFAQVRRDPAPPCVTGDVPVELWRFYVDKKWHGLGIAQELMQHVLAEAKALGGRTIWLGVWERNERAKAFYRKAGFADVGSQTFMVGADVQTDRVMSRPVI